MALGVGGDERDSRGPQRVELGAARRMQASDDREARAAGRQHRGGRRAAERTAQRAPEPGRACDQRAGRREGGLREGRQVVVGLRVGGHEGAAVALEQVGDLLRAGADLVERERDHRRAAGEQGGHVGRGGVERGIAGDRGFVDGNGVDQEMAVTDDATLSREGGAHERAGEGRPVLEQRGQLDAGGAAQGGVDLLEHAPLGEPGAQVSRRGVNRGGGVPGRQGAALGVERDHGCAGGADGGESGRREHADRAGAREEAARITGAGQVIGDDRDHLGCRRRHEWTTVSQNGPFTDRPGGGAPASPRCILCA